MFGDLSISDYNKMMIARFDGRIRQSAPRLQRRQTQLSQRSRKLVWWFTAVFLLWISYRALFTPSWLTQLPPLLSELLNLVEIGWVATLICLWFLIWRQGYPSKMPIPAQVNVLDIDELYALSPAEFEAYVARLFRRKGYRVELRGGSGDHGVDLMVTNRQRRKAIVQCKRYRNQIGPDIVRELYGTLMHEKAAHAFLVTTASISQSAQEWAKGKPMTLIDGTELVHLAALLGDHV